VWGGQRGGGGGEGGGGGVVRRFDGFGNELEHDYKIENLGLRGESVQAEGLRKVEHKNPGRER